MLSFKKYFKLKEYYNECHFTFLSNTKQVSSLMQQCPETLSY